MTANDTETTAHPRLSILHVLAPAAAGGLERVVQTLARGQAARGHSVTVAAIVAPGPRPVAAPTDEYGEAFLSEFAGTGVDVTRVVVSGRGYWAERTRVAGIATDRRIHVAHTHGYRPDVVDGGGLRARGIPTVTTVHGFTGGGWRNRLYERLQRRAFRRFDAVVAVSEPMGQKLVRGGVPASRLQVIPNAYAATTMPLRRADARAALGLESDALVIGWVGRLSREKGLDVLLAAAATVRDRAIVVAVIGDGRERHRLEAQSRTLGLGPAVRWLGLVPAAARLYCAFDIFVLSSRTEGTPIALFEAMDAKVPIVATAVGGVPAVVTPAEGVLVPPEQPIALAEALRAVWRDPDAAHRRALRAHDRLRGVYGVEPWLARYDAVYAHVCAPLAPRGVAPGGAEHTVLRTTAAHPGREVAP